MAEDNNTVVRVSFLPKCDFCRFNGVEKDARYDGSTTKDGRWAYMCGAHFSIYGMGLGLGVGQRLKLQGEK